MCRLAFSGFDEVSASAFVRSACCEVSDATMLKCSLFYGRTPTLKVSIGVTIGKVLGETPVFASEDGIESGMKGFKVEGMSGVP